METYSGLITVYIPQNLDPGSAYVSGSTSMRQSWINVANHDHATIGSPINGTTAIQAGTITAASIADGTITSAKLAAAASVGVIANAAYLKWRNAANNADLNVIRINASNQLEFAQDVSVWRYANNSAAKGAQSGGSDYNLFKVNSSNAWEFLNTAQTQTLLPKTTNTYDLGDSSTPLRWGRLNCHNIKFANGASDLNWYEEGSSTVTLKGATSTGTASYTVQSLVYTRIGRMVFCNLHVTWTAFTGTGNLHVITLPYSTNGGDTNNPWSGTCEFTGTLPANAIDVLVKPSGTEIIFEVNLNTGLLATVQCFAAGEIMATFCYRV